MIDRCVGEKGAVSSSGCSKEDENNKSREEKTVSVRLLSSEEEEINQYRNYNERRGIKSGLMRLTWRWEEGVACRWNEGVWVMTTIDTVDWWHTAGILTVMCEQHILGLEHLFTLSCSLALDHTGLLYSIYQQVYKNVRFTSCCSFSLRLFHLKSWQGPLHTPVHIVFGSFRDNTNHLSYAYFL